MQREAKLLEELHNVSASIHRTPTRAAMVGHGEHDPEDYLEVFGSWDAALEAAGFDPADLEVERYAAIDSPEVAAKIQNLATEGTTEAQMKAHLLAELQRLHADLGKSPSRNDMNEYGRYTPKMYSSRFTSWQNAVREAGLEPQTKSNSVPDDVLLKELQRLADELGRRPTSTDVEEYGTYSVKTYYAHFDSYLDACERAGVAEEE